MIEQGTSGTSIELQAASDMFLTQIEVYTVRDWSLPSKIVRPRQLIHVELCACKRTIRIVSDSDGQFLSLVERRPQPNAYEPSHAVLIGWGPWNNLSQVSKTSVTETNFQFS